MKKPLMLSQYTYKMLPRYKEANKEASMTEKGEAMTVKEIIARNTQGMPIEVSPGYWENTEDFEQPDLEKLPGMDLVERAELKREIQHKVNRVVEAQKELEAAKAAKEHSEEPVNESEKVAAKENAENVISSPKTDDTKSSQ